MNSEFIARVATRTMRCNFRGWSFGEAIALRGLLAASCATGDREPLGYVKALLHFYIGRGVAKCPEEHVAPARELLLLHQLTGESEFLEAAQQLAALYESFPLNSHGARLHRADLQGWHKQIWVDCMDIEAPFLARLGSVTGECRYSDQAAQEISAYARLLQDPVTGLFYHGHEDVCGRNGQPWARGNGWALMGLVETLSLLLGEHPLYEELLNRLKNLCDGLLRCQHQQGLWPTVISDSRTYLESTLAVMAAYALRTAFRAQLLDEGVYGKMEQKARSAALELVKDDGSLDLVSEATPVGEWAMYASRPFGVFPWGQGPLLLMLTQT